jgi:hypothetical protein
MTASNVATTGDSQTLMSSDEKAAAYDEMMAKQAADAKAQRGPDRYRVVVSLRTGGADRVLFSSVSKKRAQKWVEDHCPRGSHFHLVSPDGSTSSYEHERHSGGPQGEDIEAWQPFNRDGYQAPELTPVNTNDPWADAWEGAQ